MYMHVHVYILLFSSQSLLLIHGLEFLSSLELLLHFIAVKILSPLSVNFLQYSTLLHTHAEKTTLPNAM